MNSTLWTWCPHCMYCTDHILQDGWRCTDCGNLNSQIKEKKDGKSSVSKTNANQEG